MIPPTEQELRAVLDRMSKGVFSFGDAHMIIYALKFTISSHEPSDSLIDLMRRYENREFNHTPSEAFKAMTAKIWEGIEQ